MLSASFSRSNNFHFLIVACVCVVIVGINVIILEGAMSLQQTESIFDEKKMMTPSFLREERYDESKKGNEGEFNELNIPVVIVLCQKAVKQSRNSSGDDDIFETNKFFRQTKVLLKSIAMATYNISRIIVVANSRIPIQNVRKFISTWPTTFQMKLLIEYKTFTPKNECSDEKLFVLCTSVRLFLHEILPDEDAIIYVDSDFIFLNSPHKLARHFRMFNPLQFVGAAHNGGYYEFSTFFHYHDYYYYGNTGTSAALMLMNLTRIKEFKYNWTETVISVCRSYKRRLKLFDQGVVNIIFSEFEENLYEMDCRWSFTVYYCHMRSPCQEALTYEDIYAVHGTSNTFFSNISKKFKVLFQVIEKFKLGDSNVALISDFKHKLQEIEKKQPDDSDGCNNNTWIGKAILNQLLQSSGYD